MNPQCQVYFAQIDYWNGVATYFMQQYNNALTQAASAHSQAEAAGCYDAIAAEEDEEMKQLHATLTATMERLSARQSKAS